MLSTGEIPPGSVWFPVAETGGDRLPVGAGPEVGSLSEVGPALGVAGPVGVAPPVSVGDGNGNGLCGLEPPVTPEVGEVPGGVLQPPPEPPVEPPK